VTAREALVAARAIGGDLRLVGEVVRVSAPVGALTPELRGDLQRHKPELLQLLAREERERLVTARISEAFDRLTAAGGPWPAELFAAVLPLAQALDAEALAYSRGEAVDLRAFEVALRCWETAIVGRVSTGDGRRLPEQTTADGLAPRGQ
jgi:TubC N-terminal docking domain